MLAHAALLALPMRVGGPGPDLRVPEAHPLSVRIVEPPPPPDLPAPAARVQTASAEPARRAPPLPKPPPKVVEAPLPPPEPARPSPPAMDMLAMIEARRAARDAASEPAAPPRRSVPSPDPATVVLERNLRSLTAGEGDTSGIFHILDIGVRSGEFAFNGWRSGSANQWRQVIVVEAAPGEPVELAMVRRMIQLIRTHYTGDFNWNSRRLGRTVVMSARLEDQVDLEDFLVREFFDMPPPSRQAAR